MSAPRYSIGSETLPGLSKAVEEMGEVSQIIGKIMGVGHMGKHWTEESLKERLEEEFSDLTAAMRFFADKNGLDIATMNTRDHDKYELFCKWHEDNLFAGRVVE